MNKLKIFSSISLLNYHQEHLST